MNEKKATSTVILAGANSSALSTKVSLVELSYDDLGYTNDQMLQALRRLSIAHARLDIKFFHFCDAVTAIVNTLFATGTLGINNYKPLHLPVFLTTIADGSKLYIWTKGWSDEFEGNLLTYASLDFREKNGQRELTVLYGVAVKDSEDVNGDLALDPQVPCEIKRIYWLRAKDPFVESVSLTSINYFDADVPSAILDLMDRFYF